MLKLVNTLKMLETQRVAHEEQLALIRQFESALAQMQTSGVVPVWMTFEVHFQCSMPDHHAIMTVGNSISDAYERAVALWRKNNAQSDHPGHGYAEVFVRINDSLLAVQPVDAAFIASGESGKTFLPEQFGIDRRLIEEVGTMVWNTDDQLPGWHAENPTPAEDVKSETVAVPA